MRKLPEFFDRMVGAPVVHAHAARPAELDRLLNDPSAPIDADRVWLLISEVANDERRMQWSTSPVDG